MFYRRSETMIDQKAPLSTEQGKIISEISKKYIDKKALEEHNSATEAINTLREDTTSATTLLSNKINSEVERSTAAEQEISVRIEELKTNLTGVDTRTSSAMSNASLALNNINIAKTAMEEAIAISRATEEELSEAITTSRTVESDLATKIATINEAINSDTTEATIDEIKDKIKDIDVKLELYQDKDEDLQNAIDAVKADLDMLKGSIDGTGVSFDERFENLSNQVTESVSSLDTKITDVDTKITASITELSNTLGDRIDKSTLANGELHTALDNRIDRVQNNINATKKELSDSISVESRRAQDIEAELTASIASEISTETARAMGAETTLDTKIEEIKNTTSTTITELETDINTKIDALTVNTESTMSKVETLKTELNDVDLRVSADIASESKRAVATEQAINTKVINETNRATEAEQTIMHTINAVTDTLNDSIVQKVDSIRESVENLSNQVTETSDALTERIQSVETSNTDNDAKIESIKANTIVAVGKDANNNIKFTNDADSTVGTIPVASYIDDINVEDTHLTNVKYVKETVADLETKHTEIGNRITTLDAKISGYPAQISELDDKITAQIAISREAENSMKSNIDALLAAHKYTYTTTITPSNDIVTFECPEFTELPMVQVYIQDGTRFTTDNEATVAIIAGRITVYCSPVTATTTVKIVVR